MVEIADSMITSATPAGSSRPIWFCAVDLDLDVQVVVAQQHGRGIVGLAPIAGELVGSLQPRAAAVPQADDEPSILNRVGGASA